ncbi:MAG: CRISPR-associated protein Cas4 [Devosia sp.]
MVAPPQPFGEDRDAEPIPISALQHAVYCMRQAALIHVERMWAENVKTAEGQVLHLATNRGERRSVKGVRRVNALPLASKRLGLVGVADLVEFHQTDDSERPFPVEYKRGKPKAHRADQVQLCAQGLCLEEMTGATVPEGALFYATPKRRTVVVFDEDLRALTESVANQLAEMFARGITPPPTKLTSRCRACSLVELCRPRAVVRSAAKWRSAAIEAVLSGDDPV